jgi:DNA polymerase I
MPPRLDSAPFLLAVMGNPDGFPGYGTFWRNSSRFGLERSDCHTVDVSGEIDSFEEQIALSGAKVLIALGRAFHAITGLQGAEDKLRGYCYEPSEIRDITIRSREQIGFYQTTRKKAGEVLHAKGDPKFGVVTRQRRLTLPPDLRWIIPTFDPRKIEQARFKTLPALKADITRAIRALSPDFRLLDTQYVDRPFMSSGETGIMAFDIETIGFSSAIERIGVATGAGTWTAAWSTTAKACFQAMLDNNPTLLIGHNLAFDIPRLELAGVQFPEVDLFDTMMGAHLIQPDLYKGLEKVASLYLDLKAWKHLSKDDPASYNATDATVTLYLAEKMISALNEIGMYSLFTDTVMPSLRTLMRLTQRGIRVDRIYLGEWQERLTKKLNTHLDRWSSLAPGVNPHSPTQLKTFLYEDLGLPAQYLRTKEGIRLTTDEAALRAVRTKAGKRATEIIDVLLDVKHTQKLRSVYSDIELSTTGRVHPSYLPVSKDTDAGAASTGRLASSGPNIQNQPEEARRLFVPSEDTMLFVEWDYSQIELRIAAARSGDPALLTALNRPKEEGDVHDSTMELVGCDRTRAKNLLYGSLYGGGPRTLAAVLRQHGQSISEQEARALQSRLAAAYPGLWAWRNRVIGEGTQLGYLTNAFGRRRYFYNRWRDADGVMQSGDVPEMLAFLPQSDAADILWNRLVPLETFCEEFEGRLVTTVHDSFLMEFRTVDTTLVRSLRSVLECPFDQIAPGFRVPGNIKVGTNWGQMGPWDWNLNAARS